MNIRVAEYTDEELTKFANAVKEAVIAKLVSDSIIDPTFDYEEVCAVYAVIPLRKGIFGHLYDKLRGLEDNKIYLTVMKAER